MSLVVVTLCFLFTVCTYCSVFGHNHNCGKTFFGGKQGKAEVENGKGVRNRFKRFMNGTDVIENSWPWVVRVVYLTDEGQHYSSCGGSLIQVNDKDEMSDVVITSAHCVWLRSCGEKSKCYVEIKAVNRFRVFFGMHRANGYYDDEVVELNVVDIISHLDKENIDLALIKLEKPIKFTKNIYPVCTLHNYTFANDKYECYTLGWGPRSVTRKPTPEYVYNKVLQESYHAAPRTPVECIEASKAVESDLPSQCLQDFSLRDGYWFIEGDSGGPFVCKLKSENDGWTLYGVLSAGSDPPHMTADYSRTDTNYKWIEENTRKLSSLSA